MKLDFYYWSYQCPLNGEILALLGEYRDRLEISLHDITGNTALAKEIRIYYPTLTVINHHFRFYSPIGREFLDSLYAGILPKESPYLPSLGSVPGNGTIVPITAENCFLAGHCTARKCDAYCEKKSAFLQKNGLSVYGFMQIQNGKLCGGAEYLPSLLVPYDIPKAPEIAFISCVYLSDSIYDYKSAPLRELERYLTPKYEKVYVISDGIGVFPNGDKAFFERNGYTDCGIIAEEIGYCTLHLMEKILIKKETAK